MPVWRGGGDVGLTLSSVDAHFVIFRDLCSFFCNLVLPTLHNYCGEQTKGNDFLIGLVPHQCKLWECS